jgi:RNA polymerase sigma factor (sigma-70 family)
MSGSERDMTPVELRTTRLVSRDCAAAQTHDWLLGKVPEWPGVWAATTSRIYGWRIPPHWSRQDWREEIDAEVLAAAYQAVSIFDPERGRCLSKFIYHRILSQSLGRYRREWRFALRVKSATHWDDPPEKVRSAPADIEARERLLARVTGLATADRRLLEWLYWDGNSEEAVANRLGITKQAINKRKWKILLKLRRSEQK